MRNLANVPDLETRCKDDAVWRVFGVEWLPVRFQFYSNMSQLCHGVARANLMEEDLLVIHNVQRNPSSASNNRRAVKVSISFKILKDVPDL